MRKRLVLTRERLSELSPAELSVVHGATGDTQCVLRAVIVALVGPGEPTTSDCITRETCNY